MLVHKNTKLIDIVNFNYHVLPVLNRFGIYTGFGDKSVQQICAEKQINLNLFLNIINAFLDIHYHPEINYENFSINEIINYLQKAHIDYIAQLDQIEQLLNKVLNNCCKAKQKEVRFISEFFTSYKNDLINHITFEDSKIFPYCLEVEKKYLNGKNNIHLSVNLDYYKNDHMNIENKIIDLKAIIVKYLPIQNPGHMLNILIFELYDFENDLFNHQSIEDRLLLPKIENILKQFNII